MEFDKRELIKLLNIYERGAQIEKVYKETLAGLLFSLNMLYFRKYLQGGL